MCKTAIFRRLLRTTPQNFTPHRLMGNPQCFVGLQEMSLMFRIQVFGKKFKDLMVSFDLLCFILLCITLQLCWRM